MIYVAAMRGCAACRAVEPELRAFSAAGGSVEKIDVETRISTWPAPVRDYMQARKTTFMKTPTFFIVHDGAVRQVVHTTSMTARRLLALDTPRIQFLRGAR